MYAYQQQPRKPERRLHVVPDRKRSVVITRPVIKKKKKNIFIEFFRSIVVFSFLGAFIYFVFPTSFSRLIQNVFFPHQLPVNVKSMPNLQLKNNEIVKMNKADLYSIANPVTNYLNNDLFLNRLLLTPTIQKTHSEVTTMYHTSEMTGLKQQLLSLAAQYPMIKPAVYVWEYENGKYVDINADKIYSAASIIKLPVLVRMFKSIEAKQMTIYDEMTLTDYYKSSGSGNLQYAQSGRKYTLDQLAKTMIQDSDNTSTNMIMSKIGSMIDVNSAIRQWGLNSTYIQTWLPDLTGNNHTTARDLGTMLYNIDNNPNFLNISSREKIFDYMGHVHNNRLIQPGLGPGALFMHKTGDIGKMLGDAGIVFTPNGKKYIVVILANRPHNSVLGKDFIVKASEIIYNYMVR